MAAAQARGLSLWLMPEGEAAEPLTALIARLARREGTSPFPPHLTLLSAIELPEPQALESAERAADSLAPLPIALRDVQGHDEHFRCLFVRALPVPALQAAHATTAQAFGREPDPAFLPHVSLVYGTLTADEKRAIAQEVGADLRLRFEVRRLHLWRTAGAVEAWRELGAFAVGQSSRSPRVVTPRIPPP